MCKSDYTPRVPYPYFNDIFQNDFIKHEIHRVSCVVAFAIAENAGNELCLFSIIGQVLQNLRLKAIVLDPLVVQKPEIDSYEPINVGVVIIDNNLQNPHLSKSPIPCTLYILLQFPFSRIQIYAIQLILNVESGSGVSGSENLIERTADIMLREGYLDAGYNYVGIDDCWLEKDRDENGRLVPDRERFPNGMKAVADYLHERGFKFALYQDYGSKTCGGYPGVLGHEENDVKTFADWGVDYIKLDACNVDVTKYDFGYPYFDRLMNETGRPMVYSCSWPAYQEKPDYSSIAKHCNLWRNYGDIEDSWSSLIQIMTWFAEHQDEYVQYAGPGNWNDPDMLIIGNYGLSLDQAKVQMAVWSILPAPLLMSVDLAKIRQEYKIYF
ncbi:unnamed protein product, partial [Brenthis ino]